MSEPAVPQYMKKHFYAPGTQNLLRNLSPGLRFGLFFPFWGEEKWGADPQDKSKTAALQQVLPISEEYRKLLEAVLSRQRAMAEGLGDDVLRVEAVSTAPFITGIGNEHPLENGFSFLNPYGFPYLPASAVKGVLRRAAEDLSSGEFKENGGWQYVHVWLLFGFDKVSAYLRGPQEQAPHQLVSELAENQRKAYQDAIRRGAFDEAVVQSFMKRVLTKESLAGYGDDTTRFLMDLSVPTTSQNVKNGEAEGGIHYQGALSFWDVYPAPAAGSHNNTLLKIDILTPHYKDYYEGKEPPSDCGQPEPHPFLTIAPGCRFTFHVQCEAALLPESLRDRWQSLLTHAFQHAFEWLGFGAKTSVGYGQMNAPRSARTGMSGGPPASSHGTSALATPSTPQVREVWKYAKLSWKKNDQTLTAKCDDGRETAPWKNPDRSKIPQELHKLLFEPKKSKPVHATVVVSILGNRITIEEIQVDS